MHTSIFYRIMSSYDIRRNILTESASTLYHCCYTYTSSRIGNHIGRKNGIILDDAVACYLGSVTDNAFVTDNSIMADMYTFHDKVSVADNGLASRMGSSVDDHILSYGIVVTYHQFGLLSTIIKILRKSS